jgi:hypothetical protein
MTLLLAIAGCAVVTKVESGRVSIDGEYTVQSPIEWARVALGGENLWTVDGPALQSLRFVTALEDGDTLFPVPDPEASPKFIKSMGPLEVVDFFQTSIGTLGGAGFRSRNFRPAQFGARQGFRFEFSYLTKDGLAMQGFTTGAVIEQKLYMIIYIGTRQHYFEKHRNDAESIVSSIVFS